MLKSLILILLLGSALARRISEEKCQEYKDTLKYTQCIGFSVFDKCPVKMESYECHGVNNAGLIVGGVEAKPGEFPHMAAIGWVNEEGSVQFNCGGSLISDRFILTAAHCRYHLNLGEPVLVRLGVQNLANSGSESATVELKIKKFINHPEYNSIDKNNDIALIELEEPVKFHSKLLRPACLQQQDYFESNVTATGWGQNSTYGQTMDTLMKVVLQVRSIDNCGEKLEMENLDTGKQICAGGVKGEDTCMGDSGAPIQVAHADAPCVYDIIGLTSFGSFVCGTEQFSIYTKTWHYLDWIEGIVWPKPEDTTPLPEITTLKSKRPLVPRNKWV